MGKLFLLLQADHCPALQANPPLFPQIPVNCCVMVTLYIGFALLTIGVILLVTALFMPDRYFIEKTIFISKPVAFVLERVADLNHYARWNPWQQMDPDSKREITGLPLTPGHAYRWQGKKTGVGSLTLREIDRRHVHFDLEFRKPWKAFANDNWLFEEWGNGETKVTWQNNGGLPYPVARLMGPMLNKSLEKQFVEGLKNLKQLCEGDG